MPWRRTSRDPPRSGQSGDGRRARVLAAGADALERIDRPEDAAERAAEAVSVAVEVRSPGDEGRRHTLGVALASTGDLDGGLAELGRALDLAVRGGDLTDAAGIHRHLWQLVVAEGGAADSGRHDHRRRDRSGPGDAGARRGPRGHRRRLLLGRWDEADALLTTLDHERVDGVVQLAVAALLDTSAAMSSGPATASRPSGRTPLATGGSTGCCSAALPSERGAAATLT